MSAGCQQSGSEIGLRRIWHVGRWLLYFSIGSARFVGELAEITAGVAGTLGHFGDALVCVISMIWWRR